MRAWTKIAVMKITVSGASGLIGSALVPALREDGHEVVKLVRRDTRIAGEVRWDPARHELDPAHLDDVDAVVHLSGANVGGRRWSDSYKRTILNSRVDTTQTIAAAMAAASPRPRVLLSSSGINFYGETGDRTIDESAPAGTGFLAEVCLAWEEATRAAEDSGARVVNLRTSPVLSPRGGLLGPVVLLFKFGLGGRLGSGQQYMPWISLRDQIDAMRFLLTADDVRGPVNLTAPEPVTNAEFTRELAKALHRPAVLPVPRFALRIATGDFADEAILAGVRALPTVLLEHGYTFHDPDLPSALRWALRR
jgi:uncharacterized protein (TIGR01777 family)